jgi:hypothetical protein
MAILGETQFQGIINSCMGLIESEDCHFLSAVHSRNPWTIRTISGILPLLLPLLTDITPFSSKGLLDRVLCT